MSTVARVGSRHARNSGNQSEPESRTDFSIKQPSGNPHKNLGEINETDYIKHGTLGYQQTPSNLKPMSRSIRKRQQNEKKEGFDFNKYWAKIPPIYKLILIGLVLYGCIRIIRRNIKKGLGPQHFY